MLRALALALFCSACQCGTPCATSADCGAGRVCLATNTCAPACTRDDACLAGERCSHGGGCVPSGTCGSDLDCAASQLCQGGACGAACTANSCGAGETCASDGHCVPVSSGGGQGGGGAGGGSGGGTACLPQVIAHIRDFNDTHPDFEHYLGAKQGIVQAQLGADHKPVYGPEPQVAPIVTTSQAAFDQWYRDVPGVNMPTTITLPLTEGPPGHFVYDNSAFFPIDNQLFGNQGRNHNFHFTTEIHTQFTYGGGELFTFRGDDDVFVFVNNRLALDLGGVHSAEEGTIDFDAQATSLGITKGQTYALDVFHAERHTTESNFRIETTISCLVPVAIQ
jgi:fibro-slime domain-containing protein